jgi:protein-disulfide reductase (glutathione)
MRQLGQRSFSSDRSRALLLRFASLAVSLAPASSPGAALTSAAALLSGTLGCMAESSALARAPSDWNVGEVAWMPYEAGLAAGKARQKPIVLVFYTDWCPHCHNYSRLFHDPEVVRLSQQFVMIRVERDGHRDISAQYDIDGEYIPRTFFLTPAGSVLTELTSDNDDFRYFLDEHDPAELIALMQRALERLGSEPNPP